MTRARKSALVIGLCGLAGAIFSTQVGAVAGAVNANCYGNLDQTTYTSGFAATDFKSTTAVTIIPGVGSSSGVQLNTGIMPLNSQNIVLPFDQRVTAKLVIEQGGASDTVGWFYFDQVQPFLDAGGSLVDNDADGIADFFQEASAPTRPNSGLWKISSPTTPDLVTASYSDSGTYPRISNLIESYLTGGGGIIFKLADDDAGTTNYNDYALAADIESNDDGIADYDVNGDGITSGASRELDRAVDLGIISGGREIVFFSHVYYGTNINWKGVGVNTAGTVAARTIPYFSKHMLNPDFDPSKANTVLRKIAIGCERNDSSCYTAQGATLGWLDQEAMDRLATAAYNNITLDNTVVTVSVDASGRTPHFVAAAPASDPSRWLIGFDDLPVYDGSNDYDYNDVVFLVERATTGGEVVSQNLATEIPVAEQATTMISKIRLRYTASYPNSPAPGCTNSPDAKIRFYYSVNDTSWREITFPDKTTGDATVDVLANGDVGYQLFWKATFSTTTEVCQPILNSVNIGFEAVKAGEYKFAAPIPLSNMVYSGSVETPRSTWTVTRNDFSPRGHFRATELFNPKTLVELVSEKWDAGLQLSTRNPDGRKVVTVESGSRVDFKIGAGSALYPLVLPNAVRNSLLDGKLVYDFTGDAVVDDEDAEFIVQWTRGWEYASSVAFTPAQTTQQRAWKLGAIHNSSPALIGPPGTPAWTEGANAPTSLIAAFNAYQLLTKKRATIGVIGAQDGMLHAFSAGQFRHGADPDCNLATPLLRGCFVEVGSTPDYGDGSEAWAFIPPSQLSQLKNNHPAVARYLPAANLDAEVDGSVSVEDMFISGGFVTAIMATLGRNQPYVTGVYITTDPGDPRPLWSQDWTDPDFNGSEFSPSSGLSALATGAKWVTTVSSGLSSLVDDVFVFLIDPATGQLLKNSGGTTVGKIQLNSGGKPGSLGIAGYLNMVDADGDGLLDRIYAVDTAGRVFKVDLTTLTSCEIATLGESVFTGAAITQVTTSPAKVRLFVGGAPNPDGTANPPNTAPYHLFALEDDDAVGGCVENGAVLVYTQTLNASDKLWAAPFASGDSVFFATSTGNSQSVCAVSSGTFFGIESASGGTTYSIIPGSAALPGTAVSSLRIYDGHAFVNSVSGKTTMIGGTGWNNANSAALKDKVSALTTVLWYEL